MLTAGESSSVNTCLSCPKTHQNPVFALLKGTAMAGSATTSGLDYPFVGSLWSRAGSALMNLSTATPTWTMVSTSP